MHPAHAAAGLWSKSLRLSQALDREKFVQAVGSLPPSVFRAKGLLDFKGSDETMLFQYVCGRFELSVFPNQGVRDRFLTFIGSGNAPNRTSDRINVDGADRVKRDRARTGQVVPANYSASVPCGIFSLFAQNH
ncbi:MAG: GTP-binding protein [Desulfobacterales bacterium]